MIIYKYVDRVRQLDRLIRLRGTGTPTQLASRVGLSERALFDVMCELRDTLGCPIEYSKERGSYYYVEHGKVAINFDEIFGIEE